MQVIRIPDNTNEFCRSPGVPINESLLYLYKHQWNNTKGKQIIRKTSMSHNQAELCKPIGMVAPSQEPIEFPAAIGSPWEYIRRLK